jgi:hypothetical protein
VIAVVVVPENLSQSVTRNGVSLPPGLHELRHSDRLDYNGRSFWVSSDPKAEEVQYEPAIHGASVTCAYTKAPIQEGDSVVACPGKPGTPCGAVYGADAWRLAMESERPVKCLLCGYDSKQPKWEPPQPRAKIDLEEILQLAYGGGEHGGSN